MLATSCQRLIVKLPFAGIETEAAAATEAEAAYSIRCVYLMLLQLLCRANVSN